MSNNDKAKQKLMESMRMTKNGSDKKNEETETIQTAAPKAEKPVAKENKPAAAKKAVKNTQKTSADPFQSVSRVWPD